MTREEEIKLLLDCGFKRIDDRKFYSKYHTIYLYPNHFIYHEREGLEDINAPELYPIYELSQFLIDKGIVEKPFDAHAYLLEKGFSLSWQLPQYKYYSTRKSFYNIYLIDGKTKVSLNSETGICVDHCITKQSIDKAIKLIDFLTELEKE